MKKLIALFSIIISLSVLQGCKNDDDDINPDDFTFSYYDGDYSLNGTTCKLTATVDGQAVTNKSASVKFRCSDGKTATITLNNLINGEPTKVFNNVELSTGVSDDNSNAVIFHLADGDKDYGTGAILTLPYSDARHMTLQLN